MNVMLADDSKFMRNMLKGILEKNNYHIVGEASNGKEACQIYKKIKPDLIFLDVTMPIMNGLETVKEIIEYDKKATIIMCSAVGQQYMISDAIKFGAKDYIIKPFKEERILNSIKNIVK